MSGACTVGLQSLHRHRFLVSNLFAWGMRIQFPQSAQTQMFWLAVYLSGILCAQSVHTVCADINVFVGSLHMLNVLHSLRHIKLILRILKTKTSADLHEQVFCNW